MSTEEKRHPFLDDLTESVTLTASILRRDVSGRAEVLKVVRAGGAQYLKQKPTFVGEVEGRRFFEYDFELAGGTQGKGLVSIVRDDAGGVTHLTITFGPFNALIQMAQGVRDALRAEMDPGLFL